MEILLFAYSFYSFFIEKKKKKRTRSLVLIYYDDDGYLMFFLKKKLDRDCLMIVFCSFFTYFFFLKKILRKKSFFNYLASYSEKKRYHEKLPRFKIENFFFLMIMKKNEIRFQDFRKYSCAGKLMNIKQTKKMKKNSKKKFIHLHKL